MDVSGAVLVFAGTVFEIEDTRRDHGEWRILCLGWLYGRMVMAGYTRRGEDRHVFSIRNANEREKNRFQPHLGL